MRNSCTQKSQAIKTYENAPAVCTDRKSMREYNRCDAPAAPGLRCRAVAGRAGATLVARSFPMAAAADRHLLFGLLALQNGLINQGQLVAAFQAWTLDKARGLADHLVARGDLDADDAELPSRPWPRFTSKKHGGDVERSLAAIPAGRSTRESLARSAMPDIEATPAPASARPRPEADDDDADRTASYSVGTATSDGQRFRVLRPHARGGLGAVFVALDSELHREVALKQILDQHADDPVSRQRFLLEAEITGGLEHPGIVPVYGLGTYGDGRPYYAMRFVRGDTLKEAIERFHADAALKADPGRRRWSCASCCGGSSTSATRSTTPTAGGSCTATSSRATSSSASTARPWWSTGAWPRRSAGPTRPPASGRCVPSSASGSRPRRCPAGRWARRPT